VLRFVNTVNELAAINCKCVAVLLGWTWIEYNHSCNRFCLKKVTQRSENGPTSVLEEKKETMNKIRVIIVGPVVKCYVTDLFTRSKSFPRHYFFSGFCVKNMGNALVDNIACQICALSNGDSDFHRRNLMSLTDTYPC